MNDTKVEILLHLELYKQDNRWKMDPLAFLTTNKKDFTKL